MKEICDVLIIGTGLSGLYAALNISENLNVILVTKGNLRDCNSYLAQGGISKAKDLSDIVPFINDTIKAGNYKNDISSVDILAKESSLNISKLIDFGVSFDKYNHSFHYTKEGGHQTNRILHIKDQTGKYIVDTLIQAVDKKNNIKIYENTELIDIITNNKCIGGFFIKDDYNFPIYSKFTILATGGIGGLFNSSTNFESLIGDGLSIALKHDIELKDINYLQLHPTVLYEKNKFGKRLLLSESLRGEGGNLININGDVFVDPLLPRDKVSKAILNEISSTPDTPYVYLDLTHLSKDFLVNRFPFLYNECSKRGFLMDKDLLPVSPAHHYCMGGIKVDENSSTSLKNLYAVGEVSCTGVHGENRLASNSLLEAIVFSNRCANHINNQTLPPVTPIPVSLNYEIAKNKLYLVEFLKERVDSRYDKLFIN